LGAEHNKFWIFEKCSEVLKRLIMHALAAHFFGYAIKKTLDKYNTGVVFVDELFIKGFE
jgi:hypothetical protein